eukprot:TRINITY_DN13478_c0_g1_i2.p1 TRINITY_DN13478_c0_g1~~TRINITY_DN13478_c0_g1_i2.p1  ORF type:complete len:201 (-),score=33.05 TRINITY_DN13478_c0_g1_i2:539-1141(-)
MNLAMAEENGRKHQLEHHWTLWVDVQESSTQKNPQNWGESMQEVYTVSTVEDFWCLYHNLISPGKLKPRADMYFFKESIKPDWEEPANEQGGSWSALVPKLAESKKLLDKWWEYVLLALIGEQFDQGSEICGVCCNIRRGQDQPKNPDRLSLWTKNAHDKNLQMEIGQQFKQLLELSNEKISYQSHKERANKRTRDLYSL